MDNYGVQRTYISRTVRIFAIPYAAAVLVWSMMTGQVSAQQLETPEYLREARAAMFMANETVKYCDDIEENTPFVAAFLGDLKRRLADDGITDVKSQIGPMPFNEIVAMADQIMAENGGPFNFSEEKFCAYGRREIEKGSLVGRMIRISGT